MKKVFSFLAFFIFLGQAFAQLNIAELEDRNRRWVKEIPNYVDSYPDSLFYGNRILFFRQTPLSFKPGYSGIYLIEPEILRGVYDFYGLRGYRLSWIVRNDSLFIHRINLVLTWRIDSLVLSGGRDIIHSRMEKFTGRRFINELLFFDGITGDFPVISKYCGIGGVDWFDIEPIFRHWGNYHIYNDDRRYGSILSVKKGMVVDFKEDRTNNPHDQSHIIQREREYEMAKWSRPFYVDAEPDSLLYGGRKYLFRQSPLSMKQGYTDVYHDDEVSIFNITSNGSILGLKGYHLTWVIRNDSLFISDIYPTYYDPNRPTLCKDTIISRMEVFTGRRFINDLLFVDWITGIFGIITNHTRNFRRELDETSMSLKFKDDRQFGSSLVIKNGVITGFQEEDNRTIKN